jgi:hypothetical protein
MTCIACSTRPVYRPYPADAEDDGFATGYRVVVRDSYYGLFAVEHFPSLAVARKWAERVADGRHYQITRETFVGARMTFPVGATCHEGWRFTGAVAIYPYDERHDAEEDFPAKHPF